MTKTEWWREQTTDIGQTENDVDGVDSIHARQTTDGQWEYARVWHRFGHTSLTYILRDGELITEDRRGREASGYELLAHFRDDRARLTAVLKEISETFVLGKPHGEGQNVLRNMARNALRDD